MTKLLAADGTIEATFDVPSSWANGLAFDGTNLWLTNSFQVIKMNPENGTVLASYGTYQNPIGLIFDGSNIWFSERGGLQPKLIHNVYKMQPNDGTILSRTEVNSLPQQLVSDGNNVFVACYSHGKVDQLQSSDGALINIYDVHRGAAFLALENGNIWVTCNSSYYRFDWIDKISTQP